MKRIECSPFRDEHGNISLEQRVRATLQHGFSWYGEMQAIDTTVRKLEKVLGVEHIALTGVAIPETEITIPLLVLSPQGARAVMPTPIQGVFRAKGDEWLEIRRWVIAAIHRSQAKSPVAGVGNGPGYPGLSTHQRFWSARG